MGSENTTKPYEIIVIGAGAAGMMAAITAARRGKRVLLLEKLSRIGAKLKATGGGRCNLSNTLSNEAFIERFGKEGRFMHHALEAFDHHALRDFFSEIGVETDAPDGFRIFPVGHSSSTIIHALTQEMARLGIEIRTSQQVLSLEKQADSGFKVKTGNSVFDTRSVVLSTGGKGYPGLGAEGDGYPLAAAFGHTHTEIFPAMMPLFTREKWGASCRADTIADARITVDIKKYRKLQARGDLIFTKEGIRGPVVLDFSREITLLLEKEKEVPILINMTKGMDEESVRAHIRQKLREPTHYSTLTLLTTLLPRSVAEAFCQLAQADPNLGFAKQKGAVRETLVKYLVAVPMTVVGHEGFEKAMITRGGIRLREIDSRTMESKLAEGLFFCGEVVDLDGPCGGYNLQWAFSSGYLAGSATQGHFPRASKIYDSKLQAGR